MRAKSAPLPRLTEPLVRDGDRRTGKLRVASWDEALDRAAAGIRKSVAAHGPSTFGMFSCSKATNEVNYFAMKLARAVIGSNNIDSCNRT
jgi:formate dehydrogenase major subunit